MDIKAKLLECHDTVTISDRFRKREFVVEYAENPSYPEYLKFEAIQDKCELLDQFEIGQEIEIHFNLKGRRWTDPSGENKYFNSLQAWRVLPASQQPAAQGGQQPQGGQQAYGGQGAGQSSGSAQGTGNIPPVSAYNEAPPEFDDDELPF